MQFQKLNLEDGIVVKLDARRLDAALAVRFKDAMREIADQASGRVVVDLGKVQFLDSSGLGAIVSLKKYLGEDRALEIACLSPMVEKVFKLTRMDLIFTIHDTVDDLMKNAA